MPHAQLIGSDYVRGPLEEVARRLPDVPLLQFDLVKCPLPDASVDVVVLLNVLEHIEDDVGAVRQLARILKPGGAVVIEVPAGPHLYDVYDKVLMHYRRYRLSGLKRLLRAAGLSPSALGCGNGVRLAYRSVGRHCAMLVREPLAAQAQRGQRRVDLADRRPLAFQLRGEQRDPSAPCRLARPLADVGGALLPPGAAQRAVGPTSVYRDPGHARTIKPDGSQDRAHGVSRQRSCLRICGVSGRDKDARTRRPGHRR